mmetsp:Transcript_1966/g.3444  ORF Transcript_1966/g.3444 Transcript_1966/m.3444 type:complete len:124 (+) Transcript_1966:421-792(+)
MQNILGNILSFMDIYEKSALGAENADYISVVKEVGRGIRRVLMFDSMLSGSLDDIPDDGATFSVGRGGQENGGKISWISDTSEPVSSKYDLEKPILHHIVGHPLVQNLHYMEWDMNVYADKVA